MLSNLQNTKNTTKFGPKSPLEKKLKKTYKKGGKKKEGTETLAIV